MFWILVIYLSTLVFSVVVCCALVVALPPRYFLDSPGPANKRHSAAWWCAVIGKNLLGLAIVALGVLLSLPGIPGQGLLTVAIGVVLIDIPGKHRLVLRIVRRPGIVRRLNRLRAWFGRPPLIVEDQPR